MSAALSTQLANTFGPHLAQLCARTAQALEQEGCTALLVHSGSLLEVFQDDRTYPFEAHAPFKVWAPLADAPDSFIWFQPGSRPRLLLHQPRDYWYKAAQTPSDYWVEHFDVRSVADRSAARAELPKDLSRTAYLGDALPELAAWGVRAVNPPALMRRLDYVRAAKTPYELVCLREANRLGALGHQAAAEAFRAGASEFEIELAFLRACGQREQELPYNPIIALNEGGAVLHYQVLARQPPPERYSLLIDAGAEFAGYASDITRTYSAEDPDFAALIRRMDQMQQSLCARVRAGADWRDIHLAAHAGTAEVLRDADLILCSVEEALATAGDERLPAARHRAPPGSGGARRGRLHGLPRGWGHRAPQGAPVPATDAGARARLRRHHGAGHLLHRPAAGRRPRRRARRLHQLEPGG